MKRFIDLPAAVATLEKNESDTTLDSDESAYLLAANRHPQARKALLKAGASKKPSPEVQQHLIVLATRAATLRVAGDATLGPRVATARAALEKEGASADEAEDLIAQAVLEEGFGYADDPDHFDADFLAETLDTLTHLAAVTQERVDDWLEAFARSGADRALNLKVAELLLEAAWSEGPQPITPEHVDEALEAIADSVAQAEFTRALETLRRFVEFLAGQQVVGRERADRLLRLISAASLAGAEVDEEVEDEDDDEPAPEGT